MSETRTHGLTWMGEPPTGSEIRQALLELTEDDLKEINDRLDGCWTEWPNHTKQMAAVSRMWPDTTFTLEYQGIRLGDRHREQHRNGRVQHEDLRWKNTGFDPEKPATPGGPGTLDFGKLHRTSLPEHPGFQCAGLECGFNELESVHFQDDTGGICGPEVLWYAELADEEYQIEGSGFFCLSCLEAAGLTPEDRPTLFAVMMERAQKAT